MTYFDVTTGNRYTVPKGFKPLLNHYGNAIIRVLEPGEFFVTPNSESPLIIIGEKNVTRTECE